MCMYEVKCKCGHVGSNHYIEIGFPIKATSKEIAKEKARIIPRVKHHSDTCIISIEEIDKTKYEEIKEINDLDPYLKCKNCLDQLKIDLSSRIIKDKRRYKEGSHIKRGYYVGKTYIRNPKQYVKELSINDYYKEAYVW